MKSAQLTGIGKVEIKEIEKPNVINNNDVLVRIKMVGVCGSDIHYYNTGRIGDQIVNFPFTPGHEAAGIVESIGNKVTKVKPGQRIAIDPAQTCGTCDQCKSGRENTCRKLLFMGAPGQMEGALSEFVVVNEHSCFPIDDNLTYEQAVLSEPLAIAVYSVDQSHLPSNPNLAILGLGPIGLSVFHVLRSRNISNVYITDKIDDRLEFAQKLFPKYIGNPKKTNIVNEISALQPMLMDTVFECTGDEKIFTDAVSLLKPGGTLVIVGIPEVDDISLPIHELRRKEITILNIRRQSNSTQKALDLLTNKIINVDSLATHHYKLEQTNDAYHLVANYKDGVVKAMISID